MYPYHLISTQLDFPNLSLVICSGVKASGAVFSLAFRPVDDSPASFNDTLAVQHNRQAGALRPIPL